MAMFAQAMSHRPSAAGHQEDEQTGPQSQCREGHALIGLDAPCEGIWCDVCGKVDPLGARLHGCRKCNYFKCDMCFAVEKVVDKHMSLRRRRQMLPDKESLKMMLYRRPRCAHYGFCYRRP